MFVLVHKNRVIVGPVKWNTAMFNNALRKEKITFDLPVDAPATMPLIIDQNTRISVAQITKPSFNSKIQYLEGPYWDLSNDTVQATYQVRDQPIDAVKGTLKKKISEIRWAKEVSGTTVTIQGIQHQIPTDRNTRANFGLALSNMDSNNTINWKFGSVWMTISKSDLESVVNAINSHVQTSFDWEKAKSDMIDSLNTLEDLNQFKFLDEQTPLLRQLFGNR